MNHYPFDPFGAPPFPGAMPGEVNPIMGPEREFLQGRLSRMTETVPVGLGRQTLAPGETGAFQYRADAVIKIHRLRVRAPVFDALTVDQIHVGTRWQVVQGQPIAASYFAPGTDDAAAADAIVFETLQPGSVFEVRLTNHGDRPIAVQVDALAKVFLP